MNTNPNTQLPDEVDIEIKVKADDVFNKIDLLAIPFRPKVLEIIEGALTEYATTVYQAQQEIEDLKRWKEEAKQLLNPVWEFADKKLGVPLGECKIKAVMKYIEKSDKVLALYKQADKTNSDLIENAVTLLEKFISRHEAGLLPDRFIYNEIKQYLDGTK